MEKSRSGASIDPLSKPWIKQESASKESAGMNL